MSTYQVGDTVLVVAPVFFRPRATRVACCVGYVQASGIIIPRHKMPARDQTGSYLVDINGTIMRFHETEMRPAPPPRTNAG